MPDIMTPADLAEPVACRPWCTDLGCSAGQNPEDAGCFSAELRVPLSRHPRIGYPTEQLGRQPVYGPDYLSVYLVHPHPEDETSVRVGHAEAIGLPSITPAEARRLAAILVELADAAEDDQ